MMVLFRMKYVVLTFILLLTGIQQLSAGPPFNTDDPEPVEFKHWEYYIATINAFRPDLSTGNIKPKS